MPKNQTTKREIKKRMLGYTPKQRLAFEYFAKRHPFWKMKSIHFDRRTGFWLCLVGAVTYFCRPDQLRKKRRPAPEQVRHIKGCELGDNYKDCPACQENERS